MMLAALLKAPSFMLTEDESKEIAEAITRVSEQYDVPILDEKSRAWLNLGFVGVQVYGTRIAAEVVERKKRVKVTPIKPQPQPVAPIRGVVPQDQAIPSFEGDAVYGQA